MKNLLRMLALFGVGCCSCYAQATGNVTYVQFPGVPTGTCTANQLALDTATGNLYTCIGGAWISVVSNINASFINNVVWIDGVKYPYTSGGLQQAILDANGHGGLAGVVMIGSTANGVSNLQQISLGTTTITIPSFTYIVGAGRDATGLDYNGTGCAFDFPAGTRDSGLFYLGIEQDSGNANSGICFEGNPSNQTFNNQIVGVTTANNSGQFGYITGQKGIVLTSTPPGPNGSTYIRNNIFRDVLIQGISQPIVINADFQDRWDVKLQGVGTSQTAFAGCPISDIIDLSVEDWGPVNANTVGFGDTLYSGCTNNQVRATINLVGPGATMLNDAANGNMLTITDSNASGLGTPSPTSVTQYCKAMSPYCATYFPTFNSASNCSSSMSPALCGSASAGSVAIEPRSTTLTVNTTAVTSESLILLTVDSSLSGKLGLTCSVTPPATPPSVAARTPGVGFAIETSGSSNRPICISYLIVN